MCNTVLFFYNDALCGGSKQKIYTNIRFVVCPTDTGSGLGIDLFLINLYLYLSKCTENQQIQIQIEIEILTQVLGWALMRNGQSHDLLTILAKVVLLISLTVAYISPLVYWCSCV